MIIGTLDTETTGLDALKGDRIIEVALVNYDTDKKNIVSQYVQRIDPERDIHPDAYAVHKIANSDLVGQPKWEQVAPDLVRHLSQADVIVIHNAGFDAPFLLAELDRIGLSMPNRPVFCTMENARWACYDGKNPRLEELCFALGVDYDPSKAHAALYDVIRTLQCLLKGVERGFFALPDVKPRPAPPISMAHGTF